MSISSDLWPPPAAGDPESPLLNGDPIETFFETWSIENPDADVDLNVVMAGGGEDANAVVWGFSLGDKLDKNGCHIGWIAVTDLKYALAPNHYAYTCQGTVGPLFTRARIALNFAVRWDVSENICPAFSSGGVLTHEFGHFFGLLHPPSSCNLETIMSGDGYSPEESWQLDTLLPEDIWRMQKLYPLEIPVFDKGFLDC